MAHPAPGSAAEEDATAAAERAAVTSSDATSEGDASSSSASARTIVPAGGASTNAPTMLQDTTSGGAAPASDEGDEGTFDTSIWLGQVIDNRYKIVELLGEGGMGAVFVAEHLSLRKQVALKVIRPEFAGIPEISARFAREAMATAKLEHPHVASALDYGTLPDGSAYLVIQLVRGKPLREMLEERSLPWPQACEIVGQIADALAGAHSHGIVHRDLKPDNVLVERRDDGRFLVKVVDFGIARLASDAGPSAPAEGLTRMGMVMGTPGYMSPEQALGEQVDHRTDLYALGVVLWESIAGRPLFEASSLTELIARQLADAPQPLHAVTGQPIPEVLDQLILQLVARTASARPESAAIVRDALRKFAAAGGDGEHPTVAASGFGGMRRTEVAPVTERRPGPSVFTRLALILSQRWRDDRRSMLVLGGIAGLLLLIGVIGLAGGDDDDDASIAEAASAAGDRIGKAAEAGAEAAESGATKKRKGAEAKAEDGADESGAAEAPSKGLLGTASALASQVDVLLNGATADERRAAAGKLKEAPEGQVPALILKIADLELGKSCKAKKATVAELDALGDPKALPSLRRIAAFPKRGCGFLNGSDCWSCLRRPLGKTIAKLAALEEGAAEAGAEK